MLDPQLSDDTPFENFLRLTEETFSTKKHPAVSMELVKCPRNRKHEFLGPPKNSWEREQFLFHKNLVSEIL